MHQTRYCFADASFLKVEKCIPMGAEMDLDIPIGCSDAQNNIFYLANTVSFSTSHR